MDRNLLLAFALSFLVLSLWSMWQEDVRKQNAPAEVSAPLEPAADEPAPAEGERRYAELPEAPSKPLGGRGLTPTATPERPAAPEPEGELVAGEQLEIETPLFDAVLDSRGAVIDHWELLEYRDRQGENIVLGSSEVGGLAATPFLELGLGDLSREAWSMRETDDGVVFELARDGVVLRKHYRFDRDGYGFELRVDVDNGSSAPVEPRFLVDWPVIAREGNDFREQMVAVLHEGSVEKKPLGGLGSAGLIGSFTGKSPPQHYDYAGEVDWAGVNTPYFLSALFPDDPTQASARVSVVEPGRAAAVAVYFDPVEIPPGQTAERVFRGYVGPKEAARLEAMGGGAARSIDLGWRWVSPLTRLFAWLLHALYSVIGNYGVAIIVLTIGVRMLTAPLTMKQMRSMERMRRLQPKMKEIQEKYADDRQKQSEEIMRMYKTEKVNPLGGCFPMLLQLPVFIGLFYGLRGSIDLRQAPFVGWIDDLSAPDLLFHLPYFGVPVRVLPLVMGATMVLQQKITPMQVDPSQARMMMTVMPIMMTVLFYQFPSGLVLYWMMSNMLAIGHQLWIGRGMKPAASQESGREAKAT